MVDKFFLALDYKTPEEVLRKGKNAINFLSENFGKSLVGKLAVKINCNMLVNIDPRYREFEMSGYDIFADTKICHRFSTGRNMLERIKEYGRLDFKYFTLSSALLSREDLKKYSYYAKENGMESIAFTAPTYTPKEDIMKTFNAADVDAVIFALGEAAVAGGCDAIVLEAESLRNEKIRGLPLKKLVTGTRLNASEKGEQSRISLVSEMKELKKHINYVVVSSMYLQNEAALEKYFSALLG